MGCSKVGERIALLEDLCSLQAESRQAWRRHVILKLDEFRLGPLAGCLPYRCWFFPCCCGPWVPIAEKYLVTARGSHACGGASLADFLLPYAQRLSLPRPCIYIYLTNIPVSIRSLSSPGLPFLRHLAAPRHRTSTFQWPSTRPSATPCPGASCAATTWKRPTWT